MSASKQGQYLRNSNLLKTTYIPLETYGIVLNSVEPI